MQNFFGIGNLCKEVKLEDTQNLSVLKNTIAIKRDYKNKEGSYDTDFLSIVAYRQTAEFISKFFKKGQQIAVIGKVQARSYEASDGTKRYVTEIIVDKVSFSGSNNGSNNQETVLKPVDDDFTGELPF